MNTALMTWLIVAGMTIAILLASIFKSVIVYLKKHNGIITLGSEKEEFFVPGDILNQENAEDESE